MEDLVCCKTGKLAERLQPAIYCDTSVLIDYWIAERFDRPEEDTTLPKPAAWEETLLELMKIDRRAGKLAELRAELSHGQNKATCVYTALGGHELAEWYAEAKFRNLVSHAAGEYAVRRESRKRIGQGLKTLLDDTDDSLSEPEVGATPPLELLRNEVTTNWSYLENHGLQGLICVDLVAFDFPREALVGFPREFAILQLGLADLLHVLAARHLGCRYIASFDEDFRRCRETLEKFCNLKLLCSPEELCSVALKLGSDQE